MKKVKKSSPSTEVITTQETKAVVIEKTASEKIWIAIKDVRLDMFGLPGQTVEKYCSPVMIDPNKLYVAYRIGAVLPAMEAALSIKYDVELCEKYITVAHKKVL